MIRRQLGRSVRFLRLRAGLRQTDLGARAGMSRQTVSRIERGALHSVAVGRLDAIATALGATLAIDLRWQGEQLDRLIDAGHAALEELVAARLRGCGWLTAVEVSFNHFGDRGRADVLGFHPSTGILLVVEVKTRIFDVQDLLGRLDVKVRLGQQMATSQDWPAPRQVIPGLVTADLRSARRIVATHPHLFARFGLRGRAVQTWLVDPAAAPPVAGVLWFASVPNSRAVSVIRARRVRRVPALTRRERIRFSRLSAHLT